MASSRFLPLTSRWIDVDGWRIHCRVAVGSTPGERPPVVLVHGLGVSGRYWTPTARRLADTFDVYVPDLPGFGRSARPRATLDVPQMADFLDAWMAAMGLARASWMGNSLGCQFIVDLAVRYPGRVSCAVLQGMTPDPKHRTYRHHVVRTAVDALREPVPLLLIAAYDYLVAGVPRFVRTFGFLLADPVEEKLPRLQVPVLVVRGERDPIVPQAWAERAAALLPQGRLVVVPGAAHAVNYSAPEALDRIARRFIRRPAAVTQP